MYLYTRDLGSLAFLKASGESADLGTDRKIETPHYQMFHRLIGDIGQWIEEGQGWREQVAETVQNWTNSFRA